MPFSEELEKKQKNMEEILGEIHEEEMRMNDYKKVNLNFMKFHFFSEVLCRNLYWTGLLQLSPFFLLGEKKIFKNEIIVSN